MLADIGRVDDEVLVARARAGERASFAALVARHYDFIFRVAWKWCGRRADAEDIAQEVCARLGAGIRHYRGGAAFRTWLYAVVLNAARDHARAAQRETVRVEAYGTYTLLAEAEPEPDCSDALWAAVRLLPDKQREAVLLVYGEELGHAAAAEIMGIAEATVSWHVHEAKKRLKRMLAAGKE